MVVVNIRVKAEPLLQKHKGQVLEMEGKTPHKRKDNKLAGGEGLLFAVVQFGQA